MSAGLPLPKRVFCHGYLTVKGQKISKSMPATRVDPLAIAGEMGVDPLRYFVLREYTFGGDGDFTYEALFQRYQSDLGNDLGNLLNRTLSMVHKYLGDTLPAHAVGKSGRARILQLAQTSWDSFNPSARAGGDLAIDPRANQKIDEEKPWVLHKNGQTDRLTNVLAGCCEALRWAALLVAPATPSASREILRQLGRPQDEGTWPRAWGWPGGTITEPTPVFPRIEPDRQAALIAKWVPARARRRAARAAAPRQPPSPPRAPAEVAIDDFAKIDLRAAKVLSAERVPKRTSC